MTPLRFLAFAGLVSATIVPSVAASEPPVGHALKVVTCDPVHSECQAAKDAALAAYPNAVAGDYESIWIVAVALANGPEHGVERNDVGACAWAVLAIASGDLRVTGRTVGMAQTACEKLTPAERLAAENQFTRLADGLGWLAIFPF